MEIIEDDKTALAPLVARLSDLVGPLQQVVIAGLQDPVARTRMRNNDEWQLINVVASLSTLTKLLWKPDQLCEIKGADARVEDEAVQGSGIGVEQSIDSVKQGERPGRFPTVEAVYCGATTRDDDDGIPSERIRAIGRKAHKAPLRLTGSRPIRETQRQSANCCLLTVAGGKALPKARRKALRKARRKAARSHREAKRNQSQHDIESRNSSNDEHNVDTASTPAFRKSSSQAHARRSPPRSSRTWQTARKSVGGKAPRSH
ncbi:hypothetical protein BDV96DRAFT_339128 [Lophiotrema nucula]|uniref:Uncharacterized protein n=1 Tax=Lophiotrema nucula TaxID=690887 RepID=A0A6A5YI78_9PLEO|nr:hypothetical protein BDV96DRAFT_339128 [Lophiotrema nucula]